MFTWLRRSHRKSAPSKRTTRLRLERLEERDCPSRVIGDFGHALPPQVSIAITPLAGHTVLLTGEVTDESPETTLVTFGGVAGGSVTPDSNGYFSYEAEAEELGTITAVAVDEDELTSATAQAEVQSAAPLIELALSYGAGRSVTLYGQVIDEAPGGLTISFSGQVNDSVVTNVDGSFSLTVSATALGSIIALTTDAWDLSSAAAEVLVESSAPDITSFQVSHVSNGIWVFSGTVDDESAEGLVITFAGGVSGLGTATVQADGTFSAEFLIPTTEEGTVSAQTTDWWGLESNILYQAITAV